MTVMAVRKEQIVILLTKVIKMVATESEIAGNKEFSNGALSFCRKRPGAGKLLEDPWLDVSILHLHLSARCKIP